MSGHPRHDPPKHAYIRDVTDSDAGVVSRRVVRAPSGSYFALEPWSMLEYNAFAAAMPFVRHLRQGHRQPVLVLPGFGGSDQSTLPLRRVLHRAGFLVHGWYLGANTGPHPHIVDGLDQRLTELVEQHEGPINVIGWSLGGL